ncbi:MAG: NAD(P)H-hydrate dehydratase [Treponema sp.]|nr:NAD(P)H-hydrate dehydratase [Treponema sp.]
MTELSLFKNINNIFTAAGMKRVDQLAINGNIDTGYSYMCTAGRYIYQAALAMLDGNKNIAVICGKGNNGGDGYVAARMLQEAGINVDCFSVCDTKDLNGEASLAFKDYIELKNGIVRIITFNEQLPDFNNYSLIIDAMLGIGAKGEPHGLYANVIKAVNDSKVSVLAVDAPSGLDCDNGKCTSICIKADCTVAAGFYKMGQFFYPGRSNVGNLQIADLGYPADIVEEQSAGIFFPDNNCFNRILPARKETGSKIDHGLAFLLCGSRGMSGAAALASMSALRSGCGMVHLAVPESLVDTLAVKVTEPVLHPLAETASGACAASALNEVLLLCERMDALCVGSGLSRDPQTAFIVRELIGKTDKPAVIDADGLNAFAGCLPEFAGHKGEIVITPHMGEWKRLFGELRADCPDEPLDRINKLRRCADQFNVNILLKGSPSLAVSAKGTAVILPFGNSSLAKAGTGDVLSGIIVSLIAQGCSCFEAVILGAYLHGEAGRLASTDLTEYSVLASDLMRYIPEVIKNVMKN